MKKISFLLLVAIMLIGVLLVGCNKDPDNPDNPIGGTPKYTVKYDFDGGTGTLPAEAQYEAGDKVTVAAGTICQKNGYYLAYWNDGSREVAPGSTYTMPARDVTFKAYWAQITNDTELNVVFDIGEGATGTAPETEKHKVGDNFELPGGDGFSRAGYRFTGWYEGGEGKTYLPGAIYTMPARQITFTANWMDLANVTLRNVVYTRGGSLSITGDAPKTGEYLPAEKVTVTDLEPFVYKDHYFLGWQYQSSDTSDANNGKLFTAGDKFIMPDVDVTLVAQWDTTAGKVAINFVSSEFSEGTGPSSRYFNPEEDLSKKLKLPGKGGLTREGYQFLGWSDGKNFYDVGQEVEYSQLYNNYAKTEKEIELKARWVNLNLGFEGVWHDGAFTQGMMPTVDAAPVHTAANIFVDITVYIQFTTPNDYNRLRVLFYMANRNRLDPDTEANWEQYKDAVAYTIDVGEFTLSSGSVYQSTTNSNIMLTFGADNSLTYSTSVDVCTFTDRTELADSYDDDTDPRNSTRRSFSWTNGTWNFTEYFDSYNATTNTGTGHNVDVDVDDDGKPSTINYTTKYYFIGNYIVVYYYVDEELKGHRTYWFTNDYKEETGKNELELHTFVDDLIGAAGSYEMVFENQY